MTSVPVTTRPSRNIHALVSPAIALILSATVSGCCSVGSGCSDCEDAPAEVERTNAGTVEVADLAEWVDAEGMLTGDCTPLCDTVVSYEVKRKLSCELVSAAALDSFAPSMGGASFALSAIGAGGENSASPATLEVSCSYTTDYQCEGGRRHDCWTSNPEGVGENRVGIWLGRMAAAEAGSVNSFRQFMRELRSHGAPLELVERTKSALRDEVRHTRLMKELAEEWGGAPRAIAMKPLEKRSLLALALENATEGCTNEMFAALVALYQSKNASDEKIAQSMKVIAEDEMRHAQLAWDVHAWCMTQLNAEKAALVEARLCASLEALAKAPGLQQLPEEERKILGLPEISVLPRMAAEVAEHLIPFAAAV